MLLLNDLKGCDLKLECYDDVHNAVKIEYLNQRIRLQYYSYSIYHIII